MFFLLHRCSLKNIVDCFCFWFFLIIQIDLVFGQAKFTYPSLRRFWLLELAELIKDSFAASARYGVSSRYLSSLLKTTQLDAEDIRIDLLLVFLFLFFGLRFSLGSLNCDWGWTNVLGLLELGNILNLLRLRIWAELILHVLLRLLVHLLLWLRNLWHHLLLGLLLVLHEEVRWQLLLLLLLLEELWRLSICIRHEILREHLVLRLLIHRLWLLHLVEWLLWLLLLHLLRLHSLSFLLIYL